MKLSIKFVQKMMSDLFKPVSRNLVRSFFSYMIDSKFRTYKRLDSFLKDQVFNNDPVLFELAGQFRNIKDNDHKIIMILKWVREQIKYQYDNETYGMTEYWASAVQTYTNGVGDCDDINSLIYILARLSGVPSYLLWNCIGDVNGGGHYWLVYLSPNTGKLYPIDGTYWYSTISIKNRDVFKLTKSKYQKVWYIFNESIQFKGE